MLKTCFCGMATFVVIVDTVCYCLLLLLQVVNQLSKMGWLSDTELEQFMDSEKSALQQVGHLIIAFLFDLFSRRIDRYA